MLSRVTGALLQHRRKMIKRLLQAYSRQLGEIKKLA